MNQAPDKQAIRDELEATRAAYQTLLTSLSEDDWRRRSGNPEMTVKDLMWHMAWALGWLARSIDGVKRGKGFSPPAFLVDPARKLAMRWLARGATREAAARKYDEGHAALMARLDTLRDDEWRVTANRFGETRSVEWYFCHAVEHFEEHAADVRRGLGRA